MVQPTLPLPFDRYGTRNLPQGTFSIRTNEGTHKFEVSGRFMHCSVHGDPLVRSLGNWSSDKELPCASISRRWHQSFSSGPKFCEQTSTDPRKLPTSLKANLKQDAALNFIVMHKHLNQLRVRVLAEMVTEISKSTAVDTNNLLVLLSSCPELQKDPTYLSGHQAAGISASDWELVLRTGDQALLPWLRVLQVSYNVIRTAEPEALRASLWQEIEHESEVRSQSRHSSAVWSAPEQMQNNLERCLRKDYVHLPNPDHIVEIAASALRPSSNPHPFDFLQQPILVDGLHTVQMKPNGVFACLTHQENQRCRADLRVINTNPNHKPELIQAAKQALRDRIEAGESPDLLERAWIETPAAWMHADQLPTFCGKPVNPSQIPSYLAAHLTHQLVRRWNNQDLSQALQIEAAQLFRPFSEKGSGYIASLASSWFPLTWNEAKHHLDHNPDLAPEIMAYQEAGWQPAQITQLLHRLELNSNSHSLRLPPAPPPPLPPKIWGWVSQALAEPTPEPALDSSSSLSL